MLALCCILAAGLAGGILEPPSQDNASVAVVALNAGLLRRADVPTFAAPAFAGVVFEAHPHGFQRTPSARPGAVYMEATRANEPAALSAALAAASRYVRSLTARQNRWLRSAVRRGGDPALRRIQRAALENPARYELKYVTPSSGAGGASPALRGALLGLLVAGLAGALLIGRRPRVAPAAGGDGAPAASSPPPSAAEIAAAAGAAGGVVALSSAVSSGAYTFGFIALLFSGALLYALRGGLGAIRVLLISVIVIAPLRGALLALADSVDLPNSYLSFNAIQPSLIAASAAAVLLAHRALLRREHPLLAAAWVAIAVVCVLDFATQTVGLRLYAVGVAQYLVYPTFALLAWPLFGPRDREWLIWAFCGLGVGVALSEFAEVAGVYFAEALQHPDRLGGATGSALHSGIFLGTTAVLALGALFARWSRRNAAIAIAAIGVMVAGIGLTYTRGGLAIAAIGALVLLAVLGGRDRLRLVAVAIGAVAVGLALSASVGRSPGQLASRTGSGATLTSYPGNAQRLDAMDDAIERYRALPAEEKALGRGLASTGNAGKLISREPVPTESYPLKLLLETGALGAILIGAVLVSILALFARTAWSATGPLLKGAGAAGIGLFAESLIYPTLEVQLLALTWWVLVLLCLIGEAREVGIRNGA